MRCLLTLSVVVAALLLALLPAAVCSSDDAAAAVAASSSASAEESAVAAETELQHLGHGLGKRLIRMRQRKKFRRTHSDADLLRNHTRSSRFFGSGAGRGGHGGHHHAINSASSWEEGDSNDNSDGDATAVHDGSKATSDLLGEFLRRSNISYVLGGATDAPSPP